MVSRTPVTMAFFSIPETLRELESPRGHSSHKNPKSLLDLKILWPLENRQLKNTKAERETLKKKKKKKTNKKKKRLQKKKKKRKEKRKEKMGENVQN